MALKQQAEQLAEYLEQHSDAPVADVCWSANTGWADFNQRAVVMPPKMQGNCRQRLQRVRQ